MDPAPQKRNTTAETMRTLGGLSTVGLTFVFAVMIGAGAGYLLIPLALPILGIIWLRSKRTTTAEA